METNTINRTSPRKTASSIDLKSIIVEVEFGTPSANCANFGLCRISVPGTLKSSKCLCQVKGRLSFFRPDTLQLLLKKEKLCSTCIQKYFSKTYFQMDEGFQMPQFVLSAFDLEAFFIPKGQYPLIQSKTHFAVLFENTAA